MKRLHNFIVWFNAALFFLVLELISFNRHLLVWLVPLFFIVFVFSFWQVNGRHLNKKFWNMFLSPVFFVMGAILFYIFLVPQLFWITTAYALFFGGLLFVFMHNLNELFFYPDIHRRFTLENLSSHFNLLSVFLLFSSFYTFMFFPPIIFWFTEILVIVTGVALVYQNFWANKIIDPRKRFFIIVIALLLAELYLVLAFLPTGFYVNGIVLTVVYYILAEISRMHLLKELSVKTIKKKAIIFAFVLTLIFITTRWN